MQTYYELRNIFLHPNDRFTLNSELLLVDIRRSFDLADQDRDIITLSTSESVIIFLGFSSKGTEISATLGF